MLGHTHVLTPPSPASTRRKDRHLIRSLLWGSALLFVGAGCTRHWFRDRADRDVGQVLAAKNVYPQWQLENWHVYPDARARFADPTDPDRPPMPPDDPAAYNLSPHPQKPPHHTGVARVGGTGYLAMLKTWDAENRVERAARKASEKQALRDQEEKDKGGSEEQEHLLPARLVIQDPQPEVLPPPKESPAEEATAGADGKKKEGYLDRNPSGLAPFLVTLDQAVELGLVNSREFQDRREDLYLTALPVTTERFAFGAQFFAAEQAFREWAGKDLPRDQRNRWRANTQTGVTKVLPTGALLLLRFANQTVVNLAGTSKNGTISTSSAGLDIVQPFLRGGGKAANLEPLTQAERNLLYQIRDYARFRKEYFVALAAGQALTRGTVSVPGAAGPNGTALVTGLGDPARPDVVPGSGGRLGPVDIGGLSTQGYLPVVLLAAQLENERQNLEVLRIYENNFYRLYRNDLIDQAQYNQVRQQRLSSNTTVFQRTADLGTGLDRFKLQLGVPTDVPLVLDDTPLRPLLRQIETYEDLYGFNNLQSRESMGSRAVREIREALTGGGFLPEDELKAPAKERLVPGTLRARMKAMVRSAPIFKGGSFSRDLEKRWLVWEQLATPQQVQDLREKLSEERRKERKVVAEREEKSDAGSEEEPARLKELDLEIDLGELEIFLRLYERQAWKKAGRSDLEMSGAQETEFDRVIELFASILRKARLEILDTPRQARLRRIQRSWPELPPICVAGVDLLKADEETALAAAGRYALENRFDLMNVRAELVDSWRKIAVAANALLGTFNVEYHLESTTPIGLARPFAFSSGRTRQQLIFNAELPIVRMLERNQYRATLIAYQRQRRALMEAEDQVLAVVRSQVRQLRNVASNYNEIQKGVRQNVDLAYFQVDLASEFVNAPPSPSGGNPPAGTVGPPTAGRGAGGDPAALTQQFLGALRSLVGAKNELYRVWIDYLTNRLALYRDLELMPLDFRGVWIDDTAKCHCPAPESANQRSDEP